MIVLIDIDSGQELTRLNLNPASAPKLDEYIHFKSVTYRVVSRTFIISELGNLDGIEVKVIRLA